MVGDVEAICQILTSSSPGPIVAVCISGVGPSLVLCGADLEPLRPAILYGIDTRATEEIDLFCRRYGKEAILANAGKYLTSQALGPKIEWIRRHEPEVWRAARGWYGCHTFVVAKLTGKYVLDHHTASQCDPLYRVPEFGWHHDWAMNICEPMPLLAWLGPVRSSERSASPRRAQRALRQAHQWWLAPLTPSPRRSALEYGIREI